jgi:16S rRNA processing protein RimM
MADRVCVGRIIAPHGVRGLVKLKSFTENPRDLTAYGPLSDETGGVVKVELLSGGKEEFIARIDGVTDRTRAEACKGMMLYVDRGALPAPESSEYYHADLVGLTVLAHDGRHLGTVSALHNFGAGDILEIATQNADTILLPFSRAFVPEIDFANRQITLADYDEIS